MRGLVIAIQKFEAHAEDIWVPKILKSREAADHASLGCSIIRSKCVCHNQMGIKFEVSRVICCRKGKRVLKFRPTKLGHYIDS